MILYMMIIYDDYQDMMVIVALFFVDHWHIISSVLGHDCGFQYEWKNNHLQGLFLNSCSELQKYEAKNCEVDVSASRRV